MLEFLSQYGLFLAKTLTLAIAIIVTFGMLFMIARKAKEEDGTLSITNISEKIDDIRQSLQSETLSKNALKKWQKAQKFKEKEREKEKSQENDKRLFVIRFDGDIRASEVTGLREIVSAICEIATPKDEVLVTIESGGGFVHSYGLAASQLQRLRQRQLHLTVAIDKVAASGGYLMACVANKIIAAPFAIVGSIGVIAQIPNFHRLLNKNNIDFEMQTAGEYKRTLTMFGKNTEKARKKFQEELEETHDLFKKFITANRPQVNIQEVATGEHWHADIALGAKLVDEIQTSDDYILAKSKDFTVFEISYEEKQSFGEKLGLHFANIAEKIFSKLLFQFRN